MSNSPSRNVVDEAVAEMMRAAARNMIGATNNQSAPLQQQQPLHTQMGFTAAPYAMNGMPTMPPNYANQFPQQQQYPEEAWTELIK